MTMHEISEILLSAAAASVIVYAVRAIILDAMDRTAIRCANPRVTNLTEEEINNILIALDDRVSELERLSDEPSIPPIDNADDIAACLSAYSKLGLTIRTTEKAE